MAQSCCQTNAQGETVEAGTSAKYVVYLNSETMGRGDDELGRVLIKAFFETLTQNAQDFSHVLMVNSAVRLACENSPVLDYLQDFEEMGVAILSCGTCLKYFDLTDTLKAGEVSNMVTILDAMKQSEKVISP